MSDHPFVEAFNAMSDAVYKTAVDHGWHEDDRPDAVAICLMHSELSEALEGLRHNNPPSDHIPEFTAVEEEFADVIIRIMDTAKKRGWRVAEALLAKEAFNQSRPFKHGGKKF